VAQAGCCGLHQHDLHVRALGDELGGGIRDMDGIATVLEAGVNWAILGTVAVEQPELVAEAVREFGDHVLVGIDARNGMVAVRGWVAGTEVSAIALAAQVRDVGVREVIFTDIARDGMLQGPNIESLQQVAATPNLAVVASGGVSSLAHAIWYRDSEALIRGLAAAGLDAVEVFHPDHGPEEESRLGALVRELNLAVTAGSDFHGTREGRKHPGGVYGTGEMLGILRSRARPG
jgi:imidazole glycerol phosphate synthase subunit HisF